MPRVNYNEIDNYNTNNNGEWFSLKKDKDIANVHILAKDMDDIDFMVVHKVQVNGVDRYVNCLRKAGDPIDNCPLCAGGNKPTLRLFLQLYDVNDGKLKIWDRGKSFATTLESISRRVNPLYATQFEVERNGAPGSTKTSYALYPIQSPEVKVDINNLPEKIELLGENSIVLDKTFEQLKDYVEKGCFDGEQQVQRRQVNTPNDNMNSYNSNSAGYYQPQAPSYQSQGYNDNRSYSRVEYDQANTPSRTNTRRVY